MGKDIAEHLADFLILMKDHPASYRKACMRMWREAYGEKIAKQALASAKEKLGQSKREKAK